METDILIQMGIMFFCIALLTFWFKKRWKKKPEAKVSAYSKNEARRKWKKLKDGSDDEDRIGGKRTAERHEPEPPERSKEPEPPEREPKE